MTAAPRKTAAPSKARATKVSASPAPAKPARKLSSKADASLAEAARPKAKSDAKKSADKTKSPDAKKSTDKTRSPDPKKSADKTRSPDPKKSADKTRSPDPKKSTGKTRSPDAKTRTRAPRRPEVGLMLEGAARREKALGKLLVSHAQSLLEALELRGRELSLVLTGDEEIAALNLEWRDEDKPTDVLSFPMDDAPRGGPRPETGPLGDIVISVETTSRDAQALGWETSDLATFLLVHGILHLVGHDHAEPEEASEMRAEEDRLLAVVAPSLTRPPTPY
jgi:probable rRNA maturation factor